ncbi:CD3324 family protein [Lederbergia lenta]|uniref:Acetyltransferase, GNAT family n=1 Tax=Lederbergia lenta TaxID=1467 RepID=A0A2X4VQW9_LEDLE|nr:CD3324 family protein [Lederbergia lenta]MCM3113145.1 CD3324 family protein [Lederbergia lenta]MEC2326066.1 CD3324 family protein [Lederbergia lenta]SQI53291.1 acetyltransferase, GNAT family [Lederbergia lenta]
MKPIKAHSIFPEDLLKEIQKHVQGELVYIPKAEGDRKKWGEKSGYKETLSRRNDEIYRKFRDGATINELMELYFLSYDSIKKIVYSKK